MASSLACQEIIYLRTLLKQIGVPCTRPTILAMDNQSAIAMARDPVVFKRSKHIQRRHFFNRDCVEDGTVEPVYVRTDLNVADVLTKIPHGVAFAANRDRLVR